MNKSNQCPPKMSVGNCNGNAVNVRKANTSPSQAKMSMAKNPTRNRKS